MTSYGGIKGKQFIDLLRSVGLIPNAPIPSGQRPNLPSDCRRMSERRLILDNLDSRLKVFLHFSERTVIPLEEMEIKLAVPDHCDEDVVGVVVEEANSLNGGVLHGHKHN